MEAAASGDVRSVLHLIDTGGPGGAETVFMRLVMGLGPRWKNVPVVPYEGWLSRSLEAAGRTPRIVPSTRSFDVRYLWRLIGLCRQERVELIHTHLLSSTVYGSVAARVLSLPLIFTLHGAPDLAEAGGLTRVKYRLLDRSRNHAVFVSRYLQEKLASELRLEASEQSVIYNGVPMPRATRPRATEAQKSGARRPVVGAVGNVRPAKDYANLLRAASLVEVPARFVIAGEAEGPLFEALLSLQRTLGLDDHVHFVGFQHDIDGLMESFDVLVMSSNTEGFSLATVEAMVAGLPVVATRCGGPEEIIEDEVTGLLVPPEDPVALASAIDRLLVDAALRRRLGENGRRVARERFSERSMISSYSALYRRALENAASGLQ